MSIEPITMNPSPSGSITKLIIFLVIFFMVLFSLLVIVYKQAEQTLETIEEEGEASSVCSRLSS